jgi:Tat protein secretion system quality control protein TatD with DNase activity
MLSIQAIAEIKRISEGAVIEAVRENTRRLYGDVESR